DREAGPFGAEGPPERAGEPDVAKRPAAASDRAKEPAAEGGNRRRQIVDLAHSDHEVAALGGAQDLLRPRVGALPVEHDFAGAEGGRGADDGADVAGVLHAFQEDGGAVAANIR